MWADKQGMLNRLLCPIPSLLVLLVACSTHRPDPAVLPPTAAPVARPSESSTTNIAWTGTLLAAAEPVQGVVLGPLFHPEPFSVWHQLRLNFGLPDLDNDRIRVHREWYIDHPEYLRRITERAQRYAWYIHQEVRKRHMPAEIVLLPVVESAYDPFAYSHGRAAGLWQFIPATGRRFGLEQNWWYDGRRDVVDSTAAALDYLEYLHERFDGDWLLALAAYNSGEGTVLRAQRRNRARRKPAEFWHLDLPRETRDYVPKLLALKQLVADPVRYGIELDSLPAHARFKVVETGAQIDLAIAADLAGMDLEQLYRFNPGFNRWATAPEGPHRLLIPVERAETFRQAIAELPPEKRVQWLRHKIRSGETLSHIAKRYRTTVGALKHANELKGSRIRAGHHLLVPVASKDNKSYSLSAQQRLYHKQNRDRGGQRTEHVVDSGDTLWDLSNAYSVSVRRLASWNGMAPGDTLRVGQKLVIWTNSPAPRSAHPGTRARAVYYKVRRGDSLSRIAGRFRVRVTDVRKWNGLRKGAYLQPGQRLKLYVDVTRQAGV
jgi:membrane-bound lytic murein transglycosylase D